MVLLLPEGYRPPVPAPIARRRVGAPRVVLDPPLLDHNLRLLQGTEDFPIQAFVSQLAVEAFAVTVFPGTPRFDVQRSRPQTGQPLPQLPSHELRALSERRCSGMPFSSITSPRVSITSWPPSLRATRIARDSRVYSSISVSAGEASRRRVSWRSRSRSSKHVSAVPAAVARTTRRSTISAFAASAFAASSALPAARSPIRAAQRDDRPRQRILVAPQNPSLSLCPSHLPQQPAGVPLGKSISLPRTLDRTTPPLGA
jgi:hypothetical protein